MRNTEDAPVFMLMHQLVHLSRYHAMKRMETLNLKPSQAGILFMLNREGRLCQRELAEKIGLTPPSMTVALQKLEKSGYICKVKDENDQRITRIILTQEGKNQVDELKRVMEDMEEILYRGMSKEERLLLRRLMIEMRSNLLNSRDLGGVDMHSIMKKNCASMKHDF